MVTYLLAGAPTNLWPSVVKATTEGVVLCPSAFSITLAAPPSMMDTQEFVVPKSIPMTYSPLPTCPLGNDGYMDNVPECSNSVLIE